MEIHKVKDIAGTAGVKCILHGPSGSGKTYSISTIPDPETVLVLSAEAGLLSIKEAAGDVDAMVIANMDELREAYEYVEGEKGARYKTIVLDSLSEIAQQVLSAEMANTKDGKKPDGRQVYGILFDKVVKLVKSFRDLPNKNVILLCQQEKVTDDGGRIFYGISMPGKKLTQELPYLTDLVACLRVRMNDEGELERRFQFTDLDEQYQAKDRSGKLDDFESPDWGKIFDKINGGK